MLRGGRNVAAFLFDSVMDLWDYEFAMLTNNELNSIALKKEPELKPVTTQEIVEAIDRLIDVRIELASRNPKQVRPLLDEVEMCRRTIADGLRYHSAARGVVVGEQ